MNSTTRNGCVLSAGAALLVAGAVLVAGLLAGPRAKADDDEYFPPIRDEAAMKECSDCHMAFPPGMLPARSWRKLMTGLGDHFGENASLDPAMTEHVTKALVESAADARGRRSGAMRGLGQGDTPLRITETPWWIRAHRGEVRPGAFEDPRVGSKANCVACHRGAVEGVFEDD